MTKTKEYRTSLKLPPSMRKKLLYISKQRLGKENIQQTINLLIIETYNYLILTLKNKNDERNLC
jgi:hypothetical protein